MYLPTLEKYGDLSQEEPLIIGGMPGSGTRVAVWLAMGCDVYMGYREFFQYIQSSYDSIPISTWMYPRIRTWLSGAQVDPNQMLRGFEVALDAHLSHRRDEKHWGWKNPPNMYLIDYFHSIFPNMKYIHVVRDGRDIDRNYQLVTLKHYLREFIPKTMQYSNVDEVNFMWLWNVVNQSTINYCRAKLPDQHMIVKLEEISSTPEAMGEKIKDFIGAKAYEPHKLPQIIQVPETIGRFRDPAVVPEAVTPHMTIAGRELLLELEYLKDLDPDVDLSKESPVVVGGFGGSGTRVPVLYLLTAGVNMLYGSDYTYKGKPIYETMVEFGFKWAKDYLYFGLNEDHFRRGISTLATQVDNDAVWGWKTPSLVVLIEPLHKLVPNVKYIHITRDPRDIATDAMVAWVEIFSGQDDSADILQKGYDAAEDAYFKLWNKINMDTYNYGMENMGDNYLHVRLEDLLPRNKQTLKTLAEFAGVDSKIIEKTYWNEISTTHKIGTRIKDRKTPKFLKPTLKVFGYD